MPNPASEEIARIAEGLSEQAKDALDWVRPHSIVAPYRRGFREILGAGLVELNGEWATNTPLGLAVRAHLQERG